MKQKVIVDCDLPKDYCLNNVFSVEGLPVTRMGDFYSITKEKKLVKKVLQECGFAFEDVPYEDTVKFDIKQLFTTDAGTWESHFRVSVVSGVVDNIYEVATTHKAS
jgi:hypothetical protein